MTLELNLEKQSSYSELAFAGLMLTLSNTFPSLVVLVEGIMFPGANSVS
jgi:hypothetical protein